MTRLALLAVLLMALMPSVGRLVAGTGVQVLGGWTELCTANGSQWVDTSKQSDSNQTAPAMGDSAMGGDCAYCRLADVLPLILLLVVVAFPRLMGGRTRHVAETLRRLPQNFRGLGSQGPPVLI